MEYFDFEGASSAQESNHPRDDVASLDLEYNKPDERDARLDSPLQDQSLDFTDNPPVLESAEQYVDCSIGSDQETGVYPMFRAQEPCNRCQRMGLDCFVAKRGVMQNGCTCCVSLYRECSFTHAKVPGKFLQTFHPVSEDAYIPTGGWTGMRALKSASYGAFEDDTDGSRKNSTRLSRRAVAILKRWLRDHNDKPYPNEGEKDELKQNTGLTRTQISNWLANARRRGKARPFTGTDSPIAGAVDIPRQSQHPQDPVLMTPLDRWKYSPPEHEPATISDITRALANSPFDSSHQRQTLLGHMKARHPGSSTNESSHASSEHNRYTGSASSLDTSHSSISDFSFASEFSHRSSLSFGSTDRKERRRRRKVSAPTNTFKHQQAKLVRPFQCTFCTDSFITKYDWQRHEKSMHLILDQWTCCPDGGVMGENGILHCVFCSKANPGRDHLETHNYVSCQKKSPQDRSFYRKDHLNQHLRLMHNAKFQPCMEKWQSSITEIKSRCGFCGIVLQTWKDRVEHLAGHFKNGASMAQWQGDWGFDPPIHERVENAVQPYLIDFEWTSLDPWTTSQAQGGAVSLQPKFPNDANCYLRLSRELTTYVHNQSAQGVMPSDEMLRSEARRIMYGDCDDAWNQTCADSHLWLTIFKRDTGLETPANTCGIQLSDPGLGPPFAPHGSLLDPTRETDILVPGFGVGGLPGPSVLCPHSQSPCVSPNGLPLYHS
jgi:hypothetical protein